MNNFFMIDRFVLVEILVSTNIAKNALFAVYYKKAVADIYKMAFHAAV